jgi:putative colanic acid biosynthesis acetyltransferase WcaF
MVNKGLTMTDTRHKFSLKNKIARLLWIICYTILFRPFSMRVFRKWRSFLLRIFGGNIPYSCTVHATVKIWAPWNLELGEYVCIGPEVDCYNQGKIVIEDSATVSQKSYLCASSHDYTLSSHPLYVNPILIQRKAWVAAEAFVGPGITVGEGAVVGARAVVFKDVEPWSVVGGNPAKFIKKRILKE